MREKQVAGNPIIGEDIRRAHILQDDVVTEVASKFEQRRVTKKRYVEHVIGLLERDGRYNDLVYTLNTLIEDRSTEVLYYAHDLDIEEGRIKELGITYNETQANWDDILQRCTESIENNPIIDKVKYPFIKLLVFESFFSGEHLNPVFQDITFDNLEEVFLKEFSKKFEQLTGKYVKFVPMDEETRHRNRVMYAWAEKFCPPLLERGISYQETLDSTSLSNMTVFIESIYGKVENTDHICYKHGFEYFLSEGLLYKRALNEQTYIKISNQPVSLKESKQLIKDDNSVAMRDLQVWWNGMTEFDRVTLQNNLKLESSDWGNLTTTNKQSLFETQKRG